ncbi:MAG: NADPH:quinone oxidoreductase family protein [Rhizobiales bacterium]|nr:NADPH:quinone oxidoreductase family protein [Hyphomicrobiales bacterium]
MKAVLCKAYGAPETLIVDDIPAPAACDGEAIIAVKAVDLNFFDTLIIQGKYQFKPQFPFSPGAEVAGIIKSVSGETKGFAPGDRVVAFTGWGGAREEIAVPLDRIVKLPDSISFEMAAGLTVTYGTTLHALADRGRLKRGESLVVLGAAGGTGQAAIEIGKLMGAHVIACASSPEKLEFCRSIGADATIDYDRQDLKEAIRAATAGKGADVVYDPVGGNLAEPALRAMAWGGRYLVIGFASGDIPKFPLNLVLLKGCDVVGVFWGNHVEREPVAHRANLHRLVDWCEQGRIAPHIHRTYRLEETADALRAIAAREVKGKAILVV